MIICKNCGTVYDEYYSVCPKCGTIYEPEAEEPEQNVPKREMPQAEALTNEYHREYDPAATVILAQEFTDDDEDATIPNPPSPFPYQADAAPVNGEFDDDDDKTLPVQPEFIPVKSEAEAAENDAVSEEPPVQPETRSRESDPDATVIYSSSEEAGLPAQQEFVTDDDDDKTLPVQPEFIPVKSKTEVPENDAVSEESPVQPETRSREFDPDATVLYSSSEEAGLPAQPGYVFEEDDDKTLPVQQGFVSGSIIPEPSENNASGLFSSAQQEAGVSVQQAMPNSQYGDDFTVGSPTSSAPPEMPVSDFANTQDIVIPPAAQQPVQREPVSVQTDYPVPPVPPVPSASAYNSGISQEKKPKKKGSAGKIIAIILVCCVVLAGLGVGAYFLFFNNTSQEQNEDPVSLGEKYLSEEKWEDAIVQFKKAIEADPNNPDLYLKLADAYEGNGDTANAILTLEQGYEKTNSEAIKTRLDRLKNEHPDSTPEKLQQNAQSLSQAALSLYNSVKGGIINADSPTDKLNGLNPSKLPSAGALQEERDKAADELTVQDAITYAGLSDKIPSSDIGSYVYTDDHQIRYNGDAVGTTLKMDMTLGEIVNGPAEKPDEDSSEEESDTESSGSASEIDLVGTWKYNYDPDLLTPEQKAMLELMGLDTAMAVMSDGTFDSYMIISGRYAKLGTGTWTLDGSDFKITTYGQTTEYEFKDGKLYDKSTNGGVYFEKISSDVPEESKNREVSIPVFESETEEESSEPEEQSSEPETSLPKPLNNSVAGTWNIAFDETSASPELIAQFKESTLDEFLMILKENGTVYGRQSLKGKVKKSGTGTWTSSGNTVYVTLDSETQMFTLKDGMLIAPDVLGLAYFEKTSSSTDFPAESENSRIEVNPDDVIKPARTTDGYTIDNACKTYYAALMTGTINGDKNQTGSSRKKAAQNATIKEALEYSGSSDLLKYLNQMSAESSGSIFYENGTDTRKADAVKTDVVRSPDGSGKLGDLYK